MCAESDIEPVTTTSRPPNATILSRLVDAHCHPTEEPGLKGPSPDMNDLKLGQLCVQSIMLDNQQDTKELYEAYPDRIVPCFGLHPWFTHHVSSTPSFDASSSTSKLEHYTHLFPDPSHHSLVKEILPSLPTPVPIASFLSSLEANLLQYPSAMIGEVGLDKAFRVPIPDNSSYPHSKSSPLVTPMEHQIDLVERQLELGMKLGRNASVHSVRCPMETVELLKRMKKKKGWDSINICLHSFGGKVESIRQIQKAHNNVFFSFATIISGRSPRFHDMLRAVSRDRLLLESDFNQTRSLDGQIWEVFEEVREARGWDDEECVKQLEENWKAFMTPPKKMERRKKKEQPDHV